MHTTIFNSNWIWFGEVFNFVCKTFIIIGIVLILIAFDKLSSGQ